MITNHDKLTSLQKIEESITKQLMIMEEKIKEEKQFWPET